MSRFYGSVSMGQAAHLLGMSRLQLFRRLRESGAFGADNTPQSHLLQERYFVLETRGFYHPGCGREQAYRRVRVTPAGLHWLEQWRHANASRGTTETASPVGGRDHGAAYAGAASCPARQRAR